MILVKNNHIIKLSMEKISVGNSKPGNVACCVGGGGGGGIN